MFKNALKTHRKVSWTTKRCTYYCPW